MLLHARSGFTVSLAPAYPYRAVGDSGLAHSLIASQLAPPDYIRGHYHASLRYGEKSGTGAFLGFARVEAPSRMRSAHARVSAMRSAIGRSQMTWRTCSPLSRRRSGLPGKTGATALPRFWACIPPRQSWATKPAAGWPSALARRTGISVLAGVVVEAVAVVVRMVCWRGGLIGIADSDAPGLSVFRRRLPMLRTSSTEYPIPL